MDVYYSEKLDRLLVYLDQVDGGYLSYNTEVHYWIECTPESLGLNYIGEL